MKSINNRSFTFIETLVVISVLGLVFPVVFTTLFIILQQQVKLFRLTEVKRQGDHIVNTLENLLKNNAFHLYSGGLCSGSCSGGTLICDPTNSTGGSISYLEDQYGNQFWFSVSSGIFRSGSNNIGAPAPALPFNGGDLTSSKVISSPLILNCTKSSQYSAPLISLNFTVCYKTSAGNCVSTRPEETASLDYQSFIKLRTFPTQ